MGEATVPGWLAWYLRAVSGAVVVAGEGLTAAGAVGGTVDLLAPGIALLGGP